jgi:hypothetical protein
MRARTALGQGLIQATGPPTVKSDEEYIALMEEALTREPDPMTALLQSMSALGPWAGRGDVKFFHNGKFDFPVFERTVHRSTGIPMGSLALQAACYQSPGGSGKTRVAQQLVGELRQRGLKATMMAHDEMVLTTEKKP